MLSLLVSVLALSPASFGGTHPSYQPQPGPVAVAYPWVLRHGDKTANQTARDTIRRILGHAGYTVLSIPKARGAWAGLKYGVPVFEHRPNVGQLLAFGHQVGANVIVSGRVDWHTRSVWVGTGPKTISTATVDVTVFDVDHNQMVYQKDGVQGRSDEREDAIKDIADVIITPMITVVSGGPATPHEQRAVQIALYRALKPWSLRMGGHR